jgi:hypothetical protein
MRTMKAYSTSMVRFSLKFWTHRMAGAHEHVAAVLQQGIHRHHEVTRQRPTITSSG